ncbi:hypothetical protein LINPERHAP1_LOCUS16532 [Linum perenne]
MQFNNGASSSRSSPSSAKKEKRKEKFMKKIMSGDEHTKSASLQKRLPTLKSKASVLQTLCDVTVCVVVSLAGKVTTLWPEDPEKAREAIESYRNARQRNEMTVLEYLKGNVKKLEKKKLRDMGKRLSDWIDEFDGDDDAALVNAVGCLGSKIDELEERIRVWGLKEEEDEKLGELGVTSSPDNNGGDSQFPTEQSICEEVAVAGRVDFSDPFLLAWFLDNNGELEERIRVLDVKEEEDRKRGESVVTSSSERIRASQLAPVSWGNNDGYPQFPSSTEQIDFSASNPFPLAWIPGNNGGNSQFPSTEQSIHGEIEAPVSRFPNNNGEKLQFEQSIYEQVENRVDPAPVSWFPSNNGGYDQFPSTGAVGNGFNDLYQGISTTGGDEILRSLFADTPESSLFQGYGFGSMSSDLYQGIPIGAEALRLPFTDTPENTLLHGGAGDDFGLYETVPFNAWNPTQHQTGFGW